MLLVILLGFLGSFIVPLVHNSSLKNTGPSGTGERYQKIASGPESSVQGDSEEGNEDLSPVLAAMDREGQAVPVEKAFDYEQSLLESVNEMGLSGQWTYDERVKNLALWEHLCHARDERISTLIEEPERSGALIASLDKLCEGYSSVSTEVDDLLEVEVDERARGVNDRAELETSLQELGPDAATVFAIHELSSALEALDYAGALEVVWFLGNYNFNGVSDEFRIYQRKPSVEAIFAVSASIFCNYLGKCGEKHPVVLNLCFQFPDRPCSAPPVGIYDAVDQILTGYEIETFNQMNSSLVRLLNRYYSGDL
jgi:hypothetical protein